MFSTSNPTLTSCPLCAKQERSKAWVLHLALKVQVRYPGLLRKFQLHDKFWNDFLNIYYLNSDYLDSVVLCLLRLSYMRQWRRTPQFSIQKYFFAASVTPHSKSGEVHSQIMFGLLHSSQEGKCAWEWLCKGTQNEPQPLASNSLLRTANLEHTHKHIKNFYRVTVDAYIGTTPNLLSKLF